MAAVLPAPFALKNSTVKVGTDNYEASLSACLFTPTPVSTVWKGLTPTAVFPVAGNTTWTVQLDYPQDWATAASFSNYGVHSVDLFAPGTRIFTLAPGDRTESADGTSLAAPVVSGVAALLLSYFPDLTPMEVRDILVQSVRARGDAAAVRPGDGVSAPFGTLSISGGLLDAAAAVRLAMERAGS